MPISLKLVPEEIDDRIVQTLKFINKDEEVNLNIASKEGFTIDETTFTRLQDLVLLGQRYEEISKSQKSEFSDL